jgi:hypothetical protein
MDTTLTGIDHRWTHRRLTAATPMTALHGAIGVGRRPVCPSVVEPMGDDA